MQLNNFSHFCISETYLLKKLELIIKYPFFLQIEYIKFLRSDIRCQIFILLLYQVIPEKSRFNSCKLFK